MTKLVSKTRAWKKVAAHYKHFKDVEMRDLFDDDKKRAEKFTIKRAFVPNGKKRCDSSEKSVDDPCGCFSFIFGYGRCRDHDART